MRAAGGDEVDEDIAAAGDFLVMPEIANNVQEVLRVSANYLKQPYLLKTFLVLLLTVAPCCLYLDIIYDRNQCEKCNQLTGWYKLQNATKHEVFGQHIAADGVLRALYAHITDPQPKKALVLCFHGWLGSGKTHLSQLIAKNLYHDSDGIGSSFVKSFIGPRHFLLDQYKLQENQAKLVKTVENVIKGCGRSLFIFDEVDKMPSEIFDVLLPFMDYHDSIDGIDYRKAIFIFLSNTGGSKINEKLVHFMENNVGKRREDMTLYDFRNIIAEGAFTEKGGLFQSEMITKKLVDHYIPFLQLERRHVISCAKKEIQRRNVLYIAPEKIADRVTYHKMGGRSIEFAVDGCKNIMTHTAYFVHDSADWFQMSDEF